MSHDHDDMLWRAEALQRVMAIRESALDDQPRESVSLDGIAGRTLATDLVADEDSPPADYATMDGYAFDATEEYPYTLREEETFPEDDPLSLRSGEAVPIATGAPLPPEANAVLKREDATVTDGQLQGTDIDPGTYTYERASNVRAGETLFAADERLSPKDAILLGDLGYETVETVAPFSVAVLATGTEIHEGRSDDLDSAMLMGLVRAWGHDPTYEGTVPDEYDRVESRIGALADQYDVVLTTGGTSVGKKDYVVRALNALGEVRFHRVRLRPGKPLVCATLPDAVVFGIPGKPLGAHTITSLVVRPFFTGETSLPTLEATFEVDLALGPDGFEYVVPVTLAGGTETTDGDERAGPDERRAIPMGHVDSPLSVYESTFDPSVLSSRTRATRADGFVITTEPLEAGEQVSVVPYSVVS